MLKSKKIMVSLVLMLTILLGMFHVALADSTLPVDATVPAPTVAGEENVAAQDIDLILSTIADKYQQAANEWSIMDMVAFKQQAKLLPADISKYINSATKLVNGTNPAMTDFAKTALIFTAIGLDPTQVPGALGTTVNLIDKMATASNLGGVNGAAYALLAYDSGDYPVGADKTQTRAAIIKYLQDNQHNDGGWSLSDDKTKASDPDITGMAVSALAPYYLAVEDAYTVKETVNKAINCLSAMQSADGQFVTYGKGNANSAAMVIVALSSLGINADTDARFVKGQVSVVDALLSFATADHQFGYTNNTSVNGFSTEQGFRALIAYRGLTAGNKAFNVYDFEPISADGVRPAQTKTVNVRIEGISENKLNLAQQVINYNSQLLTAADVIKQVVSADNYVYVDSTYGGYFTALFGDAANTFNENYDGWQFRINGKSPSLSATQYNVADGDEILFYYGGMDIQYPNQPLITYSNGAAIIQFTAEKITYGGAPDYLMTVTTEPIVGATVNWGYGTNQTAAYTTNASGQITVSSEQAGAGTHSVQIKKNGKEVAGQFLPLVVRLTNDFTLTLNQQTNITESSKEIAVTSSDPTAVYNVPQNVAAVLKTVTTASGQKLQTTLPGMKVQKNNGATNFVLDLAAATKVTGDKAWDGTIALPQIVANPVINGETVAYTLQMGNDLDLTLSKPARILLPNAKDSRVGYIGANGQFTEITKVMTADAASGLAYNEKDGKVNVGADLAIWTKHFTEFVVLKTNTGGGGSGGSGGGSDITVSFQLIGDSKHGTADKHQKFETWIDKTDYTVARDAVAKVVLEKALKAANLTYVYKDNGTYVSAINGLAEFDNGPNSGWLYTVNGKQLNLGVAEYVLKDGDKIVFTYTDDHTKEPGFVPGGGGSSGGGGGGGTVTPKPGDANNKIVFTDVAANHWAKEYIDYLAKAGIVGGKTPTLFAPNDQITRAEFMEMLYKISGEKATVTPTAFTDVKTGQWYVAAVNFGLKAKITQGLTATTFAPNENITREQMAVMINRFAQYVKLTLPVKNQAVVFADNAQIATYAQDAVAAMQKAGLINGQEKNNFAPKAFATRAEAAKMLALFMQMMNK